MPSLVDGTLLVRRLEELRLERRNAVRLAVQQVLSDADVRSEIERIDLDKADVQKRLDELAAQQPPAVPIDSNLMDRLRERLDTGLTEQEKGEIVRLLVRIVVDTQTDTAGKKQTRARIEYRFPQTAEGVVETRTGIREGSDYTVVRRVVELPVGRRKRAA